MKTYIITANHLKNSINAKSLSDAIEKYCWILINNNYSWMPDIINIKDENGITTRFDIQENLTKKINKRCKV